MGIWDLFSSAPKNPDPNFHQIAKVIPAMLEPVSGSDSVSSAVNQASVAANQMIDDSRLVDMSLMRYFGAINSNDPTGIAIQRSAASQFFFALEGDLLSYREDLTLLSDLVAETTFSGLSTTVAEVLALRDQIVANGFPAYESFVFSQINATPQEISSAIDEVSLVTGSTITDADLSGSLIFGEVATALGKIELSQLLPEGFTPVPEA